jgi:hypothetical protein
MSYFFRYKSFSFEVVPGDTKFTLSSYLADVSGAPFTLTTGALDLFNVVSYKSSLSGTDYKTFWTQLAQQAIAKHYNYQTVGNIVQTSNVIEDLASTGSLIPGMLVLSNYFPAGTVISTVRDASSVVVSQQSTSTLDGASFTFSTSAWFVDYTSLDFLINSVNFGNF